MEAPSVTPPDLHPLKRALISVSDKSGLIEFAQALAGRGVELVSTGGTARSLREAGLDVVDVADVTNFPEMMDGRVKTLHPKIHGGLLALRNDDAHAQAMKEHDIGGIDLLVVNLYPFEQTVAANADFPTTIENIDIGGPALIRAGAKNHGFVSVVVDVDDYETVLSELNENGGSTRLDFRKQLAAKAYGRTAAYDAAISQWFNRTLNIETPKYRTAAGTLKQTLRYGENPHQSAGFYESVDARAGIATAEQVQGKALSYNNLNDTDAAYELVAELNPGKSAGVAIIKHANPCGVAVGDTLAAAYQSALKCDPVSAFGGVIALNRPLDAEAATEITKIFTEVIIAPDASDEAKEIIAKKKNLRLLLAGGLPDPTAVGSTVKSVAGGLLFQTRDNGHISAGDLKVVTKRAPTDQELEDLLFAFQVGKHVKSNTIVYAKNGATVGIGAGQMSRVDAARIAFRKAQDAAQEARESAPLTQGSVAASDAFFPFPDGLLVTVEAGATAVIQPGGSIRDDEVIAAADEAGIAMVFTGMRHFRH